MKKFKQFLKERIVDSTRVYSASYTSMIDVTKTFSSKQARFVIDHQDKLRFGDANHLIHLQIALNDGSLDWTRMPGEDMDKAFSKSAKYVGYLDVAGKFFAIAKLSANGRSYGAAGRLNGKIKTLVDYLEQKGFDRGVDGDWTP